MARVRICTNGHANPETALRCADPACRMSLEGIEALEAGRPAPGAAQEPAASPRPAAANPALGFPWGEVPVTGTLAVGRDPEFSPLADQLEDAHQVSRRHAVLRLGPGGVLSVEDAGSTHGTQVNGRAVRLGVRQPLFDGDRLNFSSQLAATVRLPRAG